MRGEDHLYLRSIFRYRFNSLLTKIFIGYVTILSVVIAVGVSTFFYVEHVLEQKETNVSQDYLNYVSRIVDGELIQIKERMYGFLQNQDNAANLSMIQKDITSQYKVIEGLANFTSNSKIIKEVFLYNSQLPFVISNTGTNDKSALLGLLSNESGSVGSQGAERLDAVKDFLVVPHHGEGGSTIALVTGASYSNSRNRLVTVIDEKDIYNVITNTNIVKYGSAYMVDRSGLIMSSSDTRMTGGHLAPELLNKIKAGGLSVDDQGNLVVYEKSAFFDGYYVTIIPYRNILKETDTIRNIFIYALVLLILIGAGIAGVYSRIIYNPIVGLIAKLLPQRQNEPDSKNEIEWISGFIEHIQLSNSRYEEDLILGRMLEADTIPEHTVTFFPYGMFQAAVIVSSHSVPISSSVKEYLKLAPPVGFVAKVTSATEGECYFVANGDQLSGETVKSYLAGLKLHLESSEQRFIVIGAGDVVRGAEMLNVSLKNALTAIKQGSAYDESFLFEYAPEAKETFHLYFPIDYDNRIEDALTLGSEEKVAHLVHYIFEQNKELPQIYMRIVYTRFIDTYLMIANKCGQKYVINDITENVEREYRALRVEAFIAKLYVELIPKFHAPLDTAKRVENFVIRFIEQNYSRDITIDEVAEELHLSAPYVSTLFKKNTGIAFSQYLLEYRMKKAIELLLETDYSVKEISQRVCSGTYNSFIRSFRTLIGVSPGEYRVLYQNKVNEKEIYQA